MLDGLRALDAALSQEPDWTAVVKYAQDIQEVDGTVHQMGLSGFNLEFEFGEALYNISDVVAFIKRYAESGAPVATGPAHTHVPAEANMQTLLGRLSKYIG